MRRSVLPVLLLLLSGPAIYACGNDTVAPTEPVGGINSLADEAALRQAKTDVCHYQPDEGVWKKISVGASAANAHLKNHDDVASSPGTTAQTFTQLDVSCLPVAACPCATQYAQVVFLGTINLECRDNANQTAVDDTPDFISMLHLAAIPTVGGTPRCTAVDSSNGVNFEATGLTVPQDRGCTQLILQRAAAEGLTCV